MCYLSISFFFRFLPCFLLGAFSCLKLLSMCNLWIAVWCQNLKKRSLFFVLLLIDLSVTYLQFRFKFLSCCRQHCCSKVVHEVFCSLWVPQSHPNVLKCCNCCLVSVYLQNTIWEVFNCCYKQLDSFYNRWCNTFRLRVGLQLPSIVFAALLHRTNAASALLR